GASPAIRGAPRPGALRSAPRSGAPSTRPIRPGRSSLAAAQATIRSTSAPAPEASTQITYTGTAGGAWSTSPVASSTCIDARRSSAITCWIVVVVVAVAVASVTIATRIGSIAGPRSPADVEAYTVQR